MQAAGQMQNNQMPWRKTDGPRLPGRLGRIPGPCSWSSDPGSISGGPLSRQTSTSPSGEPAPRLLLVILAS